MTMFLIISEDCFYFVFNFYYCTFDLFKDLDEL